MLHFPAMGTQCCISRLLLLLSSLPNICSFDEHCKCSTDVVQQYNLGQTGAVDDTVLHCQPKVAVAKRRAPSHPLLWIAIDAEIFRGCQVPI
ncbi:hypothetical protein LZ32DRAFT_602499 [Colletotrichum eremochloae]|nr:hypothetical protein LZ32DRAFT_602499 [Colletotrichum eremochloae]